MPMSDCSIGFEISFSQTVINAVTIEYMAQFKR